MAAYANICETSVQSVYLQKGWEVYRHLNNRLLQPRSQHTQVSCCDKVRCQKVTSTKVPRVCKRSQQKCGPQRKLSGKEELVLVLTKLRLGLTNDFLCDLFDVGKGTCSQIINTWVRFLSRELRPLVFWPDHITITKMFLVQRTETTCFLARPHNHNQDVSYPEN